MNAQFGMGGQSAMGSGQNQALLDALSKVREAKLQALQKAKGEGDLPDEAERHMMKDIGPPLDPPEIKKTGNSQRTKWGPAVAYETHLGGTLVERTWVLPWTRVKNGKAAQEVVEAMHRFIEKLMREFPGIQKMDQQMLAKHGMPWKTEHFINGDLVSVETFIAAREGNYTFGPPSHYKEATQGFGKMRKAPAGRLGGSFPGGGMPDFRD